MQPSPATGRPVSVLASSALVAAAVVLAGPIQPGRARADAEGSGATDVLHASAQRPAGPPSAGQGARDDGGDRAVGAEGPLDEALVRERAIAARVDEERAAALVRELVALGPRMGGTASGARAADRIAAEFAGMGLATVRHLARPKWCHGESAWMVAVALGDGPPVEVERAWPLGYSPASAGTLPLTETAAEGVALLAEGWRPRRDDAVPAVVLDFGRTTSDGAWPLCRSHPRGRRAEACAFGIDRPMGELLAAALDAGTPVAVTWTLETVVEEARPETVVATLPASEGAPPGHFLVCAHGDSDSGGPGANDNASGVAIVLEMARAWSEAIEAGDLAPPPVEVRFAVWGSEIHSTRDYMESELGAGLLGVLNFDQAGFGSGGQRLHVEPDDLPSNERFVRIAAAVLSDHAGAPGFPARWATNKSLGGTDSYVFSGSKRFRDDGLPSVTMFTSAWDRAEEHPRTEGMPGESWNEGDTVTVDYDIHYHSAGDTPENTTDREPENMGWCARAGLLTILRYL